MYESYIRSSKVEGIQTAINSSVQKKTSILRRKEYIFNEDNSHGINIDPQYAFWGTEVSQRLPETLFLIFLLVHF